MSLQFLPLFQVDIAIQVAAGCCNLISLDCDSRYIKVFVESRHIIFLVQFEISAPAVTMKLYRSDELTRSSINVNLIDPLPFAEPARQGCSSDNFDSHSLRSHKAATKASSLC